MSPPRLRGAVQSTVIHGLGSSLRGRQPQQRLRGFIAGLRARGIRGGRPQRREIAHLEARDEDAARAALARHDGELDEPELRDGGAARRTPREFDVPALHHEPLPAWRQPQVLDHVPPDVLPARVDQLQLEIIDRAASAQPELHGVVGRHAPIDRVARDHESFAALEVEVHLQRRAGRGGRRGEPELRITGGSGLPFREGHGNGGAGH